jgi:hypothetical protein
MSNSYAEIDVGPDLFMVSAFLSTYLMLELFHRLQPAFFVGNFNGMNCGYLTGFRFLSEFGFCGRILKWV